MILSLTKLRTFCMSHAAWMDSMHDYKPEVFNSDFISNIV